MSVSTSQADKHDVSEVKIEKFSYNWTIKNFSYLDKQPGERLVSPVFSFGTKNEIKWCISLYPNGRSKDDEGFLAVFLNWEHKDFINGNFTFSLINHKNFKRFQNPVELKLKPLKDRGYGFSKLIKRDAVLNKGLGWLSDDSFTICCDIILSLDQISNPISKIKKLNKLRISHLGPRIWLENLFLKERLSDIKLVAIASCNKSLPAHKNVLAVCSPVFEVMIKLEQKLNEIKINAKYEVIIEMLRFVYLGKVDNIESMAIELLPLAKKYAIDELSELCEKALIDQLAADNVLKIITIADNYKIEDLKMRAIYLAKTLIKDIVETDDFKSSSYVDGIKSVFEAIGQ